MAGQGLDTSDNTQQTRDNTPDNNNPLFAEAYLQGRGADTTTPQVGDKQQRVAAQNPASDKEGVKDNGDGSKVEFQKCPDGQIHPTKMSFSDGSSEQFTYNQNGDVVGWTTKDAHGTVKAAYTSQDGHTFVNMENLNAPPLVGTVNVNPDGTSVFTDARTGNAVQSTTDGKLMWHVRDAQSMNHDVLQNKDGSTVEFGVGPDGKEHPMKVHHPNNVDTIYSYGQDGKINGFTEFMPPGQKGGAKALEMFTQDGVNWTDSTGRIHAKGTAELQEGGKFVFHYDDGGQSVWATDGSVVQSHKLSDGKIHTTKVIYPGGHQNEYQYDNSGNPVGVTTYNAPPELGGRETMHYTTTDGNTWTDQKGVGPALHGKLEVTDGKHIFHWNGSLLKDVTSELLPNGMTLWFDKNGQLIRRPGGSPVKE